MGHAAVTQAKSPDQDRLCEANGASRLWGERNRPFVVTVAFIVDGVEQPSLLRC